MSEFYFLTLLKWIFDVFFGFINMIFSIELVPGVSFGPVCVVIVVGFVLIFFTIKGWFE